jgi:putative Mg2+ transporter-C (MgtC) family protein
VHTLIAWGTLAAAGDTSYGLDADVAARLLSGALLGGLIGLEREASDQAAGLRTHIAVALGAALFGVVSTLGFVEFDQERAGTTLQADVTRVASNVVVGIGFLGAGVIFRQGNTIRNLTTAASLWTVAAIGLACGVGDISSAAVAAVVLLASLVVLRPVRTYVRRRWSTRSITVHVHLRPGVDPTSTIDALDEPDGIETDDFAVTKEDGRLILSTGVVGRPATVHSWIAEIAASPEVERVDEE